LTLRLLRASLPELLITTMPNVMELGVDGATLAFSAALAVACTAIFGAGPANRMVRTDLQASLKSGGHGTPGPRHQRMRAALMVGEVAISLILLVAAGLLVRTFNALQHVDTGFNPNRVLTMMTSLPDYRYADAPAQGRFFEAALERISQMPGVTSAGFVNTLPFSTYNDNTRYVVEGGTPPVFGVLALLLATVGIYGVISYAVSQQTREFGLRLALGGSPGDVLQLVLRRGLSLVLAGAALGVVGALGVTRLMAGILYAVTPADVTTYLSVASGLILVGGLACFLPALRAMRVDPVVVLRTE
jgi:ABC-type antimicrobial peptide transport system permease subunit